MACQHCQHRLDLLAVVACLRHEARNDEHAAGVDCRLRVVALVEAATGLHDARLLVRQVDLILVLRAADRRLRNLAARSLSSVALGLTLGELRFVFRLRLSITLMSARL
jgi:hypothetical protein